MHSRGIWANNSGMFKNKKKGKSMEEIQKDEVTQEPEIVNSNVAQEIEGQVKETPSEQLILGKFKSVDDLSKAYTELEKLKGSQAQELGKLRLESQGMKNLTEIFEKQKNLEMSETELRELSQKYNNYFADPCFTELYKEAYFALGKNLDSEKLINLLENYVSSRIFAKEAEQSLKKENDNAVSAINFSENKTNSLSKPEKRLDEMSDKEVEELLKKLI